MRDFLKENYDRNVKSFESDRYRLRMWEKILSEIVNQINKAERFVLTKKSQNCKINLLDGFIDFDPSLLVEKQYIIKKEIDRKNFLKQQKSILNSGMKKVDDLKEYCKERSDGLQRQHKQILYLEFFLRMGVFGEEINKDELIDFLLEDKAKFINKKYFENYNDKFTKKNLISELVNVFNDVYKSYENNISNFLSRFLNKLSILNKFYPNEGVNSIRRKILNYIYRMKN